MKVVVTGASGLLGRAVHEHFTSLDHEVLALANSRATPPLVQLDLLNTEALRKTLQDFQPDFIVHSAAERRPDVVEKEPERSQELNVDVPGRIAQICKELEIGTRVVYISTDYVFDGSKPPYQVDSEPNPLNAYGTSKLLGERAVSQNGQEGKVTSLRVPVLYGPAIQPNESAVNVLQTTIVPPTDGRVIKMDAYAVRYPTNVQDVAKVLGQIAHQAVAEGKDLPPITHFQATEAMTKYDMCNVMSRLQNRFAPPLPEASVSHLDPEFEIDPMAATARPRHCKLDTSVLRDFGVDVSHSTFEEWWADEMKRQAQAEEERQRKEAEEQERRRIAAEEADRQRIREEEAEKKRLEEERRKKEEEEAEKRRIAEEEAEKRRLEQEREAAAQKQAREAEEQQRREKEEQERQEAEAREKSEEDARRKAADQQSDASKQREDHDRDSQSDPQAASSSDKRSAEEDQAESSHAKASSQGSSDAASASAGARTPADQTIPARDKEGRATSPSQPTAGPAPSSPNPSFSSLRARPTPPGSSARSPSNSQPPSLRNAEGIVTPLEEQPPPPVPAKRVDDQSSTSAQGQSEASSSTAGTPQSSQTIKSNPFRNQSPRHEGMPSTLNTSVASSQASISRPSGAAEEDEDPYGQPSPRHAAAGEGSDVPNTEDTSREAFRGGYGEVQFGLNDDVKPKSADTGKEGPNSTSDMKENNHTAFSIKVGDPHKVGDAMTGHIVYTVRTATQAPGFKASTFSALRRYNDFRWLHAALVHNNPGIIIPPVPEKVRGLISRFSPDLVEARRHGLEICVNKIANHPVLAKDEDLKLFLESADFSRDVKLRDARKGAVPTPEQKTWMGWSGTVGVNSGHKFNEYDEWFDQQKAYLDALEAQLKGMVKSINALAQSRKELADTIAALSHSLLMLSGSSLSRSLSASFAGLGDLQRRAQELEDIQSDSDIRHFGSVLYEYERLVGSVRKAFSTRIDCWHLMQKADDELKRTRIKHEKLKREPAANHYYEESLKDLAEIEDRALERRADCDKVSRRCKEEMKRFDKEKVEDMRVAIDQWLSGQIERKEELLEEWLDYTQKCLGLDLSDGEKKANGKRVAHGQAQVNGAESKQDTTAAAALGAADDTEPGDGSKPAENGNQAGDANVTGAAVDGAVDQTQAPKTQAAEATAAATENSSQGPRATAKSEDQEIKPPIENVESQDQSSSLTNPTDAATEEAKSDQTAADEKEETTTETQEPEAEVPPEGGQPQTEAAEAQEASQSTP
ncbi:unnamed protein product [Sympodiomycopsis kandeliae]